MTDSLKVLGTSLLNGERVEFAGEEPPEPLPDEALNSRYAKGEVRIVTEQARYPLAGILQMLNETVDGDVGEKRYKLDPEYQRRHRWTNGRKSRLIESFLMNVPVPPVFLYERDLARFEVMDGRQRLTALREFYSNEFALEGLEYWRELDGRYYHNLPSKVRDGIDRRYLSSIILLKETAATEERATALKKIVFERLNSGGVELSNQESRNAVYSGPLNDLCLHLSKNHHFREMWNIPQNVDSIGASRSRNRLWMEMGDVELVLRFFAYRQLNSRHNLNKISALLDNFLAEGNAAFSGGLLDELGLLFESTIEFLWEALGKTAFSRQGKRKQPVRTIYDPLMWAASQSRVRPHYSELIKRSDELRSRLKSTYDRHDNPFGGRKTNFTDALERNRLVLDAIDSLIVEL